MALAVSWSGYFLILNRCKLPEERDFYLRLTHREGWDKRETDRQLRSALFERAIIGRPKVSPAVTQSLSRRDCAERHATGCLVIHAGPARRARSGIGMRRYMRAARMRAGLACRLYAHEPRQ